MLIRSAVTTHEPMADRNADRNTRDVALIARIVHDETQALEALMRLYTPALVSFAFRTVQSNDVAEEVVQDIFVSLWEHRFTLEIRGSVASYLFRAVRNRALNVVRYESAQQRLVSDVVALYGDIMPDARNLGDVALDTEDLKLLVARALRIVPPRSREIFALSWEHDLSYQEIADLLGIGVPSVKNQLYRATKRLAEYFGHLRRSAPPEQP